MKNENDKTKATRTIRVTEQDYRMLLDLALASGRPSDLTGAFRSALKDKHDAMKEVIARVRKELGADENYEKLEGDALEEHEEQAAEAKKKALDDPEGDAEPEKMKGGNTNPLRAWASKKDD